MDRERKAWLALAASPKLDNRRIWELARQWGPLEAARRWARPSSEPLEGQPLTPSDTDYPPTLLRLQDPPIRLFWRGRPWSPTCQQRRVAVVGSRRATAYGLRMAYQLGQALADHGVGVVSGLALGVDAAAHYGALSGKRGHPLGVLGCGIDRVFPLRNDPLYRKLAECGTLFSEYPGKTPAHAHQFPARNRLIAALSDVVVVVEAGRKSGTSHTVRAALELGVPVMAVPGAVGSPNREGIYDLLRDGAALATSVKDILAPLGFSMGQPPPPAPPPPKRLARVLDLLDGAGSTFEELQKRLGMSTSELGQALGLLELGGWLRRTPGGYLISN